MTEFIHVLSVITAGSHITLEPKTGCPLKLSRAEPGQYLDGRPLKKLGCCWKRC